jgi:hypothetical protein
MLVLVRRRGLCRRRGCWAAIMFVLQASRLAGLAAQQQYPLLTSHA